MNERLQKFIDELKTAEQTKSQDFGVSEDKSNQSVMTLTEDNNSQKTGGKIMGRFIDRVSEYPGRIKLTKVKDEGSGTIYDCEMAEGAVSNAGTPLNAQTLNAFEDDIKANMKLYRHRVRLTGGSTNNVTPVAYMEFYTTSATAISSVSALAAALDISGSSVDLPVSGWNYYSNTSSNINNTLLITCANISSYSIYLRGMIFGYSSGTGTIERVSVSVSTISDTVKQII